MAGNKVFTTPTGMESIFLERDSSVMRLLTTPMTTTSCNESNDAHDVAICIVVFMRKVENTPKCGVCS